MCIDHVVLLTKHKSENKSSLCNSTNSLNSFNDVGTHQH